MLNTVLVPLDGSALSEQALAYAEQILAPNGKLILLSVLEMPVDYEYALVDIPLTMVSARSYNEAEFNNANRRIHDYLNSHARKLNAKGYETECVVESGEPATVITDVAKNHHAAAIAMTTHGRTGFSRWIFGSVTQKVIATMICPVLVVPGFMHAKEGETANNEKVVHASS